MAVNRSHYTATANRRQRQIEDCLFKNLLHHPYPSISVADICRQVGISRKAFYNYYHDKDSCLCAIIDDYLREAMLYTSLNIPDNATKLEACTILLGFWKDQKDFFDIIFRNNLLHFLLVRNMRYVLEEDRSILDLLSTPEVKSDTDILACYMMSQLTLVMQWYFRGFDSPTEEMARKLLRIIHAPMIQPMGE